MIKSRKLFDSLIYYIRYDGPTLKIGSEEFPTTILDILIRKNGLVIWESLGIFKLITAPILHNIWLAHEAAQQIKEGYLRTKGPESLGEISWNQGIIISPIVARNFLLIPHEKRNGFTDSNTTTNPTSEDQADDPQPNAG